MTAESSSSFPKQQKYAAKVPLSIQTPDVVETSRLGRLEFFDADMKVNSEGSYTV